MRASASQASDEGSIPFTRSAGPTGGRAEGKGIEQGPGTPVGSRFDSLHPLRGSDGRVRPEGPTGGAHHSSARAPWAAVGGALALAGESCSLWYS
jgi:hypothetical protein